jgi:hypothetical protein
MKVQIRFESLSFDSDTLAEVFTTYLDFLGHTPSKDQTLDTKFMRDLVDGKKTATKIVVESPVTLTSTDFLEYLKEHAWLILKREIARYNIKQVLLYLITFMHNKLVLDHKTTRLCFQFVTDQLRESNAKADPAKYQALMRLRSYFGTSTR